MGWMISVLLLVAALTLGTVEGRAKIVENYSKITAPDGKETLFCVPYKTGSSQHRWQSAAIAHKLTMRELAEREHKRHGTVSGGFRQLALKQEEASRVFRDPTVRKLMIIREPYQRIVSFFFNHILHVRADRPLPDLTNVGPDTRFPFPPHLLVGKNAEGEKRNVSFNTFVRYIYACASRSMTPPSYLTYREYQKQFAEARKTIKCSSTGVDSHLKPTNLVCRTKSVKYDEVLNLETGTAPRDLWIKAGVEEVVRPYLGCILDQPPCTSSGLNPTKKLFSEEVTNRFEVPELKRMIGDVYAADYELGGYEKPPSAVWDETWEDNEW